MAKKRRLTIRTPRRAMAEVKPAAEPEIDEEELEKAMAEAEREFFKQQAEEDRKLRELAQMVPGPDAPNPRDKIWRYLIAEYGFGPETLWRMTPKTMKLYLEARPPRRRQTLAEPVIVSLGQRQYLIGDHRALAV